MTAEQIGIAFATGSLTHEQLVGEVQKGRTAVRPISPPEEAPS